VGLTVGLDIVIKKKITCPCWESKSSRPACSQVTMVTGSKDLESELNLQDSLYNSIQNLLV
jgi:hypothetical protein